MKGIAGVLRLILFVFGLVMGLIALVIIVWPFLSSIIHGACWANAGDTAKQINTEFDNLYNLQSLDARRMDITLGDCVKVISFVNREDLADYIGEKNTDVQCALKRDGYIIVLPSSNARLNPKPICKPLPCDECYFGDVVELEGPGKKKGVKTHSISITISNKVFDIKKLNSD